MTITVTLERTWCGSCNVPFALPDYMLADLRETGDAFWCPNGHRLTFTDNEAKRLRKQLQEANAKADRAATQRDFWRDEQERTERQRRAAKGQLTKTKNRIANGVCPCCNRSFSDLAAHMQTQHPDYGGEPPT